MVKQYKKDRLPEPSDIEGPDPGPAWILEEEKAHLSEVPTAPSGGCRSPLPPAPS